MTDAPHDADLERPPEPHDAKTWLRIEPLLRKGLRIEDVAVREGLDPDSVRDLVGYWKGPSVEETIRAALDVLHAGDGTAKWAVMLACLSSAMTDRLHVFVVGGTRMGKSHILESMERLFPDRFKRYDGASPKALFYEAKDDTTFLRGRIVFFDEIADLEDLWPILKKIADSNSERLEHHTVLEKRAFTFVLDGLPVILTAGAVDVVDDQINGRFLKISVDESAEQTNRVLSYAAAEAARIEPAAESDVVVKARTLLSWIMDGGPYRVVVPEAECIDFAALHFSQPRVDVSLYLKLVKARALLHRNLRPRLDADGGPVIVAIEKDIVGAHRLWLGLGPTRHIKLDTSAFAVLEAVPFGGPAETKTIKEALAGKLAPSTVSRKLQALYERGLVDKEQGDRYNLQLWERIVPDADLGRMRGGAVSTDLLSSFYLPWKAPDFASSIRRKEHVERWAVSTLSQVSPGFEKEGAEDLAKWVVEGG